MASDGELVANHAIVSAGFTKGLSLKNEYLKEFVWTSAPYLDPTARKLATKMTTKYDPDTGCTSITAHGPLKDCSEESFTDVIDHSGEAAQLSMSKSTSGSRHT